MLGKVFKAYDIRATYPKPLNEKLAWQIGYGGAQYLTGQAAEAGFDDPMMRHIVVGRDMRKSSPSLAEALSKGIRDYGAHVVDIGMVDTPFVYFAVNHLGCAGGVQTTASHNPPNYNGFKICRIGAKPVGMVTGLEDIRRNAAMAERDKIESRHGRSESRDLWDAYRAHVLRFLDPALLSGSKSIKVVVDASNGMAGTMIPAVFAAARGLKITKLNFENDGVHFAHDPNPLVAANLETLREKVKSSGADLGVCFDGDADRCVVVDEKGAIISCDLLAAWLARGLLKRHPGAAIVYDLRSSKALPETIKQHGGKPVKSRVGHVFMKQKMAETGALFGVELSGHFYFRDNFNADSGAIAFATIVSELARARGNLSGLIKPERRYAQSGEINFENENKEEALAELRAAYPAAKTEELDGLTLDAGPWWCNVRMSNTEPLLRLNLEGPDPRTVQGRVEEVARYLGKRIAH